MVLVALSISALAVAAGFIVLMSREITWWPSTPLRDS